MAKLTHVQASASEENMAPHATADEPPQPILTKHELPADKAKYIVTKPELEECLKKVFGSGVEFDVSVSPVQRIHRPEETKKQGGAEWLFSVQG